MGKGGSLSMALLYGVPLLHGPPFRRRGAAPQAVSANLAVMLAKQLARLEDYSRCGRGRLALPGVGAGGPATPRRQQALRRCLPAEGLRGSTGAAHPPASPPPPTHAPACSAQLRPKFELFSRLCSAEPGAGDALACALQAGGDVDALALPLPDFAAALAFASAQLPRLSRRRFEQLRHPFSLYAFVRAHPVAAGAVLQQHPRGFTDRTAPWLREHLRWDDAALAHAALTEWLPELCRLDTTAAQRWLDWLLGLGLTRSQAGRLLLAGVGQLAGGGQQLESRRARVGELAAAWGVSPAAAAALCLAQPFLSASRADLTGRLVEVLQVGPRGPRGWLRQGHATARAQHAPGRHVNTRLTRSTPMPSPPPLPPTPTPLWRRARWACRRGSSWSLCWKAAWTAAAPPARRRCWRPPSASSACCWCAARQRRGPAGLAAARRTVPPRLPLPAAWASLRRSPHSAA